MLLRVDMKSDHYDLDVENLRRLYLNGPLIERFINNVNDPDLVGVLLQDNFPTLTRNPSALESEQINKLKSNAALLKQLIVIILVRL